MFSRKRKEQTLEIVKEYIDSLMKTNKNQPLPIGYNPIEYIRGGLYHWIAVPFNKVPIFCQLRCPTATEIESCGDMSNIISDVQNKNIEYEDILKIRNYQESLSKLVLNIPTFDHIASLVNAGDFVVSEKRKELKELTDKFENHKKELNTDQKTIISTQIKTLELQLAYILPDDTMAFLTKWAMGNDVTAVQKINRESFLRAAILANINHKAPSDYISGVLTDFNKQEIDAYANMVYQQFQEDQKIANSAKYKWVGRGHK